MLRRFAEWLIKRYVLRKINKMLKKHNVGEFSGNLALWTFRLQNLLSLLAALNAKIMDGEVTDAEFKDAVNQVNHVIKEW